MAINLLLATLIGGAIQTGGNLITQGINKRKAAKASDSTLELNNAELARQDKIAKETMDKEIGRANQLSDLGVAKAKKAYDIKEDGLQDQMGTAKTALAESSLSNIRDRGTARKKRLFGAQHDNVRRWGGLNG